MIPRLAHEPRRGTRFDRQAYRARNRIQRLFNRLKQFRRIATRYEKRASNYLAMLTIAATCRWIIEVVSRSQEARGFIVLPKRWIVERTYGWLHWCRRLNVDYERLPTSSEAFIHIVMIRLMFRRLA